LEFKGKHVWIDPFLRGNPRAVVKHDAIKADVIVITHGHGDHVGDSLAIAKRTGAVIAASYEITNYCQNAGVTQTEPANMGGTVRIGGISITFTMAWHSSALELPEGPPHYMGSPMGAIVKSEGKTVYHMGDTALFSDIRLIVERLGPID